MRTRPRHFYHFTGRLWWRFIAEEGITRGEAPVTLERVLDFPNLTDDPDPGKQGWTRPPGTRLTRDGRTITFSLNKLAVRIRVLVPPSDTRLVRWTDFARREGATRGEIRAYIDSARGGAGSWWVYRGVIHPSRFEEVEFLDDGEIHPIEAKAIARTTQARSSIEARKILHGRS